MSTSSSNAPAASAPASSSKNMFGQLAAISELQIELGVEKKHNEFLNDELKKKQEHVDSVMHSSLSTREENGSLKERLKYTAQKLKETEDRVARRDQIIAELGRKNDELEAFKIHATAAIHKLEDHVETVEDDDGNFSFIWSSSNTASHGGLYKKHRDVVVPACAKLVDLLSDEEDDNETAAEEEDDLLPVAQSAARAVAEASSRKRSRGSGSSTDRPHQRRRTTTQLTLDQTTRLLQRDRDRSNSK